MKRAIVLVIVVNLCVLAVVPGWTGVVACWFLAGFAVWIYYRVCRYYGHVPGHTCRCHSRRCRGRC